MLVIILVGNIGFNCVFLCFCIAFMPKIREGRSIQIDSLCDFGNMEQTHKVDFLFL